MIPETVDGCVSAFMWAQVIINVLMLMWLVIVQIGHGDAVKRIRELEKHAH